MDAADYFRSQARECRRLAESLAPSGDREGLLMLARHYEAEARRAVRDPSAPAATEPRPVMPTG